MLLKKNCAFSGPASATHVEQREEETVFTALQSSDSAAYTLTWALNAPIADTYILLPACAYDGNRFEAVSRRYPPMFIESELGRNPPIRMTEVPRLSPEGDSFMDVTTGDLAVPCVCVLNKREKQAFMLFFNQGAHGLNHGVTLTQEGDLLHVTLRAPAKRRLVYRWDGGVPSLYSHPEADRPLSVRAGEETVIPHRVFTFPCEDIPSLYRAFFEKRAQLFSGNPPACLPFSAFWDMSEAHYNETRFNEEGAFYMLGNYPETETNRFSQWQAGWVGSGLFTLTMLTDGNELSRKRAVQTLLHAARYQSEAGFYYGIVFHGKPEYDCFHYYDEKYRLLLIRKHADLTLFMFRQIAVLRGRGEAVPAAIGESAVRAADALVRLFDENHQLGQFIDVETGEIIVGGSAAGGMAPAALCAAYAVTGEEKYLSSAREIARFFYRTFTQKGLTTGGPGEILQAPDSESAAALMESYAALYETDRTEEWLNMALDAAHQLASWVVSYDYEFPASSRLARRGVFARGSVWANVQNKHSAPGLCTVSPSALLKLYRATGDTAYLRLMSEIARFMPQVASTPENPMMTVDGRTMAPGEMCERVNLSDWEGTENIGDSIFGSSSWPEASLMVTFAEIPGVYAVPERNMVCASDHVNARLCGNVLQIENPTVYPARVRVMVETEEELARPLGLVWQNRFRMVSVGPGETAEVPLWAEA